MDMREEARHLHTFRHNFRDNEDIVFPEPLTGMCRRCNTISRSRRTNSSISSSSPTQASAGRDVGGRGEYLQAAGARGGPAA